MTRDPLEFPKLRWPLDAKFMQHQGRELLVLTCPLGITPEPLVLVSEVAPIVSMFQGTNSIDQIVARYSDQGLQRPLVEQLVQLLDSHLMLQTPGFAARHAQLRREYLSKRVREAALAGAAYPLDPRQLEQLLDGHLDGGLPAALRPSPMLGLVAPHIDYRRGGACYGITYRALREQRHDLYVLIGTSHQYSERLFHLTPKDFASPLGTLACDTEIVQQIAARHGVQRSFEDEFLHRREHSLELQLPFMQRSGAQGRILPILVGSFHRSLQSGRPPPQDEEYQSFVSSLTEALRERRNAGSRICVVAGVDMAHIGRYFGDREALTPEKMREVEQRDLSYINALLSHDKQALFSHVAEDQDARRICGFPTMYTVLDLFDRLGVKYSAELFDYRQAVDYESDCAVTFAGIGMYEIEPDQRELGSRAAL